MSAPKRPSRSRAGGRAAPTSRAASGPDRLARVGERIRAALSDMILRDEIREPAARGAIVTAVVVTRDLSLARVYLRSIDEADVARRRALVSAFERARGHVRHALAGRVSSGSGAMRGVPELRFAWDDAADRGARVDAVLAEIAEARASESASREAEGHEEGGGDEP